MSKNMSHLAGRDQNKDLLLHHLKGTNDSPNLQSRQEIISSLTEEYFASEAQLTSAASFYDLTCAQNSGKKVFVCNGTSCLLGGQQNTLIEQLRQHTPENQIGEISCQGRCYNQGSFMYQGKTYSGLKQTDLEKLFSEENKVGDGAIPAFNLAKKSLLIDSEEEGESESDLELFYQLLTQYLDQPKKIIEEVSAALLRGRGGAGFPFFQKLLACAETNADEKFVIVNADEGDPGAYSDRYLLEKHPHLILFGCLAAGLAIGAKRAYLYIRGEYPQSINIIKNKVRDLRNLLRSSGQMGGFINDFEFVIVEGQGAYICGEETALINSIEGQRPEVRIKPPYPVQHGLFNKPTLVSNVETLANFWWILSHSGKVYANIGTKASTGTKLISINHQFTRPGVYEIDMGMPLSAFLKKVGGFRGEVKALQIGGPLGAIIPESLFGNINLSFESLSQNGFVLGHGSIIAIPKMFRMIDFLKHLFEFCAHESCGKCYPCRIGTKKGAQLIRGAIAGQKAISRTLFNDLLETLEFGSLCALGGGLPLPVRNILYYFSDELAGSFC